MFLTIIAFIIVLAVLVLAHELGHFLTAKKFGVKAEEFGFGYPPRLCGWYRDINRRWRWLKGGAKPVNLLGTVYSLNLLPLGGFVKIKGENGDNEEADSFVTKPIWQRAIILSAGVLMNIALAWAIISAGMMMGIPQVLDNLSAKAHVSKEQIQIVQVEDGSLAEQAGVKLGDIIQSIDGQTFFDSGQLVDYVNQRTGQPLQYQFLRGQEEINQTVTPQLRPDTGKGGIGIAIAKIGLVKYPWYLAIWQGGKATVALLWAIILGFVGIFQSLFAGQGPGAEIVGPVGIAALTGQMASIGLVYLMQFTAILSLNLALINFLPFPALDGARVGFLLLEKLKGRPIKRETEGLIHNIGFIVLLLVVAVVTFRDIANIGCWTCKLKEWFSWL